MFGTKTAIQALERHVEHLEKIIQNREQTIGRLITAVMEKRGEQAQVNLDKERGQEYEVETPVPGEFYTGVGSAVNMNDIS